MPLSLPMAVAVITCWWETGPCRSEPSRPVWF